MCRLIALPPGTAPELAHELVRNFVKGNDDGVGEAYVEKGEFKINKYPYSYHEAVTKKDKLFSHMPYGGWTIAHVRLATHGEHTWNNTHPFIKGDTATVHNGIFGLHSFVKAVLGTGVRWSGDCDSEVAAYLLNKLGPDEFYKQLPLHSSVYLGLKRDGSLNAIKFSHGDLKVFRTEQDTFILASEFPWKDPFYESREAAEGILKLDKLGHATNFQFEKKQEHGKKRGGYYSQTTGRTGHEPSGSTNCNVQYDLDRDIHNPAGRSCATNMLPFANMKKKTKKLDLWDWPTEDELQHYEEKLS